MSDLSKEQAYLAMIAFLEMVYARSGSDDIGSLLGDLSLLPDGSSADPAAIKDWNSAVSKVISGDLTGSFKVK
jgi:hypothetical protein